MTRSHSRIPSLPVFIVLAALVAMTAFGATRWFTAESASQLPNLDLPADGAAARPGALDPAALFATRSPATVMIDSTINGEGLTGAGIIVSTDGTIVTASHVVHSYDAGADAETIIVSLTRDGQTVTDELQARLVARDRYNDLAILKIDPSQASRPLVAAKLATSELAIGSDVAQIGYPLGEKWTQTTGSVSNVHRSVESRINAMWNIPDAVQFDAPTNPGNSGGPLFNARGEVVGIVQQISSKTETNTGISFAISAQIVQRTLRLAAAGATDIPYAYAGIGSKTLTPQLARAIGAEGRSGALVQSAEGPAATAGISAGSTTVAYAGTAVQKGDVIVELAGHEIVSSEQLDRLIGLLDPNTRVEVKVLRDGETHSVQLEPGRAA